MEISGVIAGEAGGTGVWVTGTVAFMVCGAGVDAAAAVGCELVHPDRITTATTRAQQRKIPWKIALLFMTEPTILRSD
jgi:hypothetical protein